MFLKYSKTTSAVLIDNENVFDVQILLCVRACVRARACVSASACVFIVLVRSNSARPYLLCSYILIVLAHTYSGHPYL